MAKKIDKQKVFRVSYSLTNYWDIKAKDLDEARDLVTCISNRRLAERTGTEFNIDSCCPLEEE